MPKKNSCAKGKYKIQRAVPNKLWKTEAKCFVTFIRRIISKWEPIKYYKENSNLLRKLDGRNLEEVTGDFL